MWLPDTGKDSEADFLKSLGASRVITRDTMLENKERPMLKEQYAGVVDTVGGEFFGPSN